jgi:hypothetical protein
LAVALFYIGETKMLYYGLNTGQGEFDAATSPVSAPSREILITIDETNCTTKQAALTAITHLYNVVLKSNYPL